MVISKVRYIGLPQNQLSLESWQYPQLACQASTMLRKIKRNSMSRWPFLVAWIVVGYESIRMCQQCMCVCVFCGLWEGVITRTMVRLTSQTGDMPPDINSLSTAPQGLVGGAPWRLSPMMVTPAINQVQNPNTSQHNNQTNPNNSYVLNDVHRYWLVLYKHLCIYIYMLCVHMLYIFIVWKCLKSHWNMLHWTT